MSVINGAIGKSPVIDKLNHLGGGSRNQMISEEMEHIIRNDVSFSPIRVGESVPVSFEKCREELKKLISR